MSYSVQGASKSISLLDETTGDMKSTYQVLGDIAEDWNKMSSSEQQAIAISLAGKNQFEVFGAVLQNFSHAVDATNTALDSSGSAARENAAYMESLQAKLTALKGQFQELVLGDGGLTAFVKLLADSGTQILKFANSDIGKLIIQIGLLSTAFNVLSKGGTNLLQWFLTLGTSLEMAQGGFSKAAIEAAIANKEFVGFGVATQAVTANLLTMAKAWLASPLGMGAIAVASMVAIKEVIEYINEAFERNVEKLNEMGSEYESQTQKIESTKKSLEEVRSKIEEINKLGKLDLTDEQELQNLRTEEAILENQLRLEQEKLNTQKQQLAEQAKKTLNTEAVTGTQNIGGSGVASTVVSVKETPAEAVSRYTEEIQKSQNAINSYLQEKQKLINSGITEGDEIDKLNSKIDDEISKRDEARDNATQYADAINDALKYLDEESDLYKDNNKVLNKYLDTTDDVKDSLEEVGDEAEQSAEKTYDLGNLSSESLNSMNEATKDQQDMLSTLGSDINDITAAYQTAVDALYEYNNQGYLSVDTYSQLMQIAPQYLATLIDENGQFYANADGVTTLYQAKVYEMGITAARAQVNLAASLAGEAGAYASLGNAAIDASGGIWELVKAEMAEKIAKVEDPRDLAALQNRVNAINNLTKSTIANAKATTASIQPTQASTGATKKNTGARKNNANATKGQTDALKAHKKALEEEADALEAEIDDYETVIDYVKDLLQEEQEALEDAKEAELDAIQDKIDALEKEQEAFEENIDAQIDALEKQRDETEDYWDAQIEAIENENTALEENIKLQQLQEAVAKAKTQKTKVLKGGQFVYSQDEEAVSDAQQELSDYELELAVQKQLEELEKLKEQALESIDNQIEQLEKSKEEQAEIYEEQLQDLQDHYDAVEAEYDRQIKQYDAYMKQFEDMLNASAKKHAEILYNELVGEQGNWDARIKALSTFVKNYEAKKNELDGIKNQINAITNQISALESQARGLQNSVNGIAGNVGRQLNSIKSMAGQAQTEAKKVENAYNAIMKTQYRAWYNPMGLGKIYIPGWYPSAYSAQQALSEYFKQHPDALKGFPNTGVDQIDKWAKGVLSTPDDGIALVADPASPSNRELVIGSKINEGDGVLTSLKKGTGVIPSGRNLTENLVNLARWSQNGGLERAITNNNSTVSKIVRIENINLPNVQNGEDFIQYLENNFINDSIQFSNIRE